jgi:hypothetical protein
MDARGLRVKTDNSGGDPESFMSGESAEYLPGVAQPSAKDRFKPESTVAVSQEQQLGDEQIGWFADNMNRIAGIGRDGQKRALPLCGVPKDFSHLTPGHTSKSILKRRDAQS